MADSKKYERIPMKTGFGIDVLEAVIYGLEAASLSPISCFASDIYKAYSMPKSGLEEFAIGAAGFIAPQVITYIALRLPIYKKNH